MHLTSFLFFYEKHRHPVNFAFFIEAAQLFLLGVPEDDLSWNFEYMRIVRRSLLESRSNAGGNLDNLEMAIHLQSYFDHEMVHCFEKVGLVGMATSEFGYYFFLSFLLVLNDPLPPLRLLFLL
jgi:hypothetical protein